jgi:hypothetical protein
MRTVRRVHMMVIGILRGLCFRLDRVGSNVETMLITSLCFTSIWAYMRIMWSDLFLNPRYWHINICICCLWFFASARGDLIGVLLKYISCRPKPRYHRSVFGSYTYFRLHRPATIIHGASRLSKVYGISHEIQPLSYCWLLHVKASCSTAWWSI